MKRILISHARIVDGSGKASYKGNVLVEGDRISSIDTSPSSHKESYGAPIDQEIDARGLVLAPGFIDSHSHSDLEVLLKPVLEPKIRQGITTEILGQDGISMAPLPPQYIKNWRLNIGGLDGDSDTFDWNYESVDGYFARIEASNATSNVGYLVPHGNVRMAAMGLDDKTPDEDELQEMCEITDKAMRSGCLGLSTGLIYIPCAYAKTEELIALCKVVAKYDGLFVVHQRSEANQILESMDEVIRIGRESKVRIHFSHFKICGKNNADKLSAVLAKIDSAKAEGIEVTFDFYPYTAGSTMLSACIPPWAHAGSTRAMLDRLKDPDTRERIRKDIETQNSDWDNFLEFAGSNGIYITSVVTEKNQPLVGKSLDEIGKLLDKDPLDALFDLLIEEENKVGMIDFYGFEEHLDAFVSRDEMSVCTDGLLGGKVHPRAYGSFPRIISEYVTKKKLISLESAIYRMSGFPAQNFRLKDRGTIDIGNFADLILFDPESFSDESSYELPEKFPEGLRMVMVNGKLVYTQEGAYHADASSGALLKQYGK